MTRRGSIVYYLSAWILGCFFVSVAVWVKAMFGPTFESAFTRSAFGLLFFYFYGLLLGAFTAILAGFVLRALMAAFKCKTPLHWAVAGAVLVPGLVAALGVWGRHIGTVRNGDSPLLFRVLDGLTLGPKVVLDAGWWLAIPPGAVTAYFLCRIQRAFAPQRVPANV